MPQTDNLPYSWWESPNIHFCTIKDFRDLCAVAGAKIERAVALNAYGKPLRFNAPWWFWNLFGEQAVFLLSRSVRACLPLLRESSTVCPLCIDVRPQNRRMRRSLVMTMFRCVRKMLSTGGEAITFTFYNLNSWCGCSRLDRSAPSRSFVTSSAESPLTCVSLGGVAITAFGGAMADLGLLLPARATAGRRLGC